MADRNRHRNSQDLYPTYLQKAKGFSSHSATIATIIGNCVCHLLPAFLRVLMGTVLVCIGCNCVSSLGGVWSSCLTEPCFCKFEVVVSSPETRANTWDVALL